MMTDRDVEELLNRYRPSDPRPELRGRLFAGDGSVHVQARTDEAIGRTWPWAVAAAVLLSISVGLHATAAVAPVPPPSDVAEVADRLGGDSLAWTVARVIIAAPSKQSTVIPDPLQEIR